MMRADPRSRVLDDQAALLAGRIGLSGWRPPRLELGTIGSGLHAGIDLAAGPSTLRSSTNGTLRLDVERRPPPWPDRHIKHWWAGTPHAPALQLKLGGGTLEAQFVRHGRRFISTTDRNDPKSHWSLSLRIYNWKWRTTEPPRAWVGVLRGGRTTFSENLEVWDQIDEDGLPESYTSGVLLEGAGWRWFLFPLDSRRGRREQDCLVVLDTSGEELCAARLNRALRVLRFVLGGPATLGLLVGVTDDLRVVAAQGQGFGALAPRAQRRPPTPASYAFARGWQPSFFRALSAHHEASFGQGDPTYIALETYVETLKRLDLDSAYLNAQIALEAFCAGAMQKERPTLLVKDVGSWRDWVEARRAEISEFAPDADAARRLVNKVLDARNPPSSDRVVRFFEQHGVQLPDDIKAEILRRNRVAHVYMMSPATEMRQVEEEADRLAVVQTLLAAAVALHCGYEGPIGAGRNSGTSLSWWRTPVERLARPSRYLVRLDFAK